MKRPPVDELVDQVFEPISDEDAIALLEKRGYVVHKPAPPARVVEVDLARLRGSRVRVGVISDTHFGSKFQQPTFLREHLRYMKRRGVEGVIYAGDVTDGPPSMHPGFVFETWAHGADAQARATLEALPEIGRPYWVIGGNHDAAHFKAAGHDIVAAICRQRDDMVYLSPEQDSANRRGSIGYLRFGSVLVQVCHPHLPGTRQRSYRLEIWIENLNAPKPNIVVMGNFHKAVQIDYRNVQGIMVPSFQAQTAWMASKGLESMIGSCIIEFGYETKGLSPSFSIEWLIERVPRMGDYPGSDLGL